MASESEDEVRKACAELKWADGGQCSNGLKWALGHQGPMGTPMPWSHPGRSWAMRPTELKTHSPEQNSQSNSQFFPRNCYFDPPMASTVAAISKAEACALPPNTHSQLPRPLARKQMGHAPNIYIYIYIREWRYAVYTVLTYAHLWISSLMPTTARE